MSTDDRAPGVTPRLETARLVLRGWERRDVEAVTDVYADEETARFIGGRADRDQAWRRLAAQIGHWVLLGFGYWAVEEMETGRFVGCVGLWRSPGWPEVELGYWLVPVMQGKGYATEAAAAARDFGFDVLGLDTIVSYIHPDNDPSKRVAERLGARFEKTFELWSFGPHCLYRYSRSEPSGQDQKGDRR